VLALAKAVGYDVDGTILCVGCAEEWADENGVSLDPPPEGVGFPLFLITVNGIIFRLVRIARKR
jgi:hypothetical protein